MNCLNCNELLPEDNSSATRKYCNDKCRFAFSNAKRKNLISLGKELAKEPETLMEIASPPETSISLEEHFAITDKYDAKIEEYRLSIDEFNRVQQYYQDYIEELKNCIKERNAKITELKDEKDDIKDELKVLQRQYDKLQFEQTLLVESNKVDLRGIEIRHEQSKKSAFSELLGLAKDRDAMMSIATLVKGIIGEKKVPLKE